MIYKVMNPRKLPAKTPVLSSKDGAKEWMEGDKITDGDLPEAAIISLVNRGFLKPDGD